MNDNTCVSSKGEIFCDDPCTYGTSAAKCVGDDLYVCSSENVYYLARTCENHDCYVSNTGYGQCGATDECTYGTTPSSCGADGNTVTYCQAGNTLYTKGCGTYQCVRCEDGFVGCTHDDHDTYCGKGKSGTEDHTKTCVGSEKVILGGEDGDCCDVVNYMPTCGAQNKSITYCNGQGKVKTKSCNTTACGNIESNAKYDCK